MAAVWDIFWCKVFFKEYIKHYRKMTDEQIVKDVRQSMDDLEDLVSDTDTFGSQMVRWAQERADEPFATAARENGKKGGRPKKKKETTADGSPVRSYRPRKVPHPKGEYEVFDFASENGVPEWVANEFWQRFFVERDGTDTDGNNIDNWKGALINYGKSRKRETA